jgi:hypothetical protein
MDDASLESLGTGLGSRVGRSDIFAHLFKDGKELGVL